ncbi:hypothetical protein FGB62_140g116 [Gracilaria domingensis]|nr:hypothetical protein FGB62_140g116 [Gracilaria domingensis]
MAALRPVHWSDILHDLAREHNRNVSAARAAARRNDQNDGGRADAQLSQAARRRGKTEALRRELHARRGSGGGEGGRRVDKRDRSRRRWDLKLSDSNFRTEIKKCAVFRQKSRHKVHVVEAESARRWGPEGQGSRPRLTRGNALSSACLQPQDTSHSSTMSYSRSSNAPNESSSRSELYRLLGDTNVVVLSRGQADLSTAFEGTKPGCLWRRSPQSDSDPPAPDPGSPDTTSMAC